MCNCSQEEPLLHIAHRNDLRLAADSVFNSLNEVPDYLECYELAITNNRAIYEKGDYLITITMERKN